MLKCIEASGKTEDAAIASALAQLGLERDDVSVEVLERAKSGFLGFGGTPARVKVSYEAPDEAAAPAEAPKVSQGTPERVREKTPPIAPVPAAAPVKASTVQRAAPKADAPLSVPTVTEAVPEPAAETPAVPASAEQQDSELQIQTFLEGLMAHMGVDAKAAVRVVENDTYKVSIEGEQQGALIGHRGETLDAIQQLCNYAVNRNRQKRLRIHVDVEDYREKREESLRRLAHKVAHKVVKTKRNITLEPMNAYKRHVIHEALQDMPEILTYSTGTEPNRRTVVAYSKGRHNY